MQLIEIKISKNMKCEYNMGFNYLIVQLTEIRMI